jgi:hypothetical protein
MHATTLAAGVGAGVEAAEDSMVAGVEGAQPFCTGEVPAFTSKGEVLPPIMPFATTLTVFRCAQSRRRRKTMPFAPLCKQTVRLPTSLEPQRTSRPKARSLWSRSPPTTNSLSPLPVLTLRRSLRRRSTGCSTAALTRRNLSTRLPTSSAQTAVTVARKSLRRRNAAARKNLRRSTSAALAATTLTQSALTTTATAPTRTMTMVLSLLVHTHQQNEQEPNNSEEEIQHDYKISSLNPQLSLLHLPTSPRRSLCTSTMTTQLTTV